MRSREIRLILRGSFGARFEVSRIVSWSSAPLLSPGPDGGWIRRAGVSSR